MSLNEKETTSTLLGKIVPYPISLDRGLLQAIERSSYRNFYSNEIKESSLAKIGLDNWQSFEVSCLDSNGNSKIFWLSFDIPADSKYIVESKSLKLYLGSLFNQKFNSKEDLREEILSALEGIIQSEILDLRLIENSKWGLFLQNNFSFKKPFNYQTLDKIGFPKILNSTKSEVLVFHGFRSLCPVTSQPDYATVVISYKGHEIDKNSLATYLQSFRNEEGFHEYWTEKIFLELLKAFKESQKSEPELELKMFYARRGGISINPSRKTKNFYNSLPSLKFLR